MPYFVVFALSGIGLTAILDHFDHRSEKIGLVVGSFFLILVSILAANTSMLYRGVLFIFGLGLVYLLRVRNPDFAHWKNQALWLLLAVVLIIRGGYLPPALPRYGNTHLEQSVYFLQDQLPESSKVLAGAPANIWAARMTYYGINSYDIPGFADADEFLVWVRVQNIQAIYVDEHFPQFHQLLVESLSGSGLSEIFSTPIQDIVIYEVCCAP